MPRIAWVEDNQAAGPLAEVYAAWQAKNPGRSLPGILKCFSARPDFLRLVVAFSDAVHFSDGHLTRRVKEMLATYVSGLNHCVFWLDSHGAFLQLQGGPEAVARALERGDLDAAPVSPPERVLLELAATVTLTPARTTDADVQRVRAAGWTDAQIAEAVYVIALFAFFNRVADAFGLDKAGYGQLLQAAAANASARK